MSWFRWDSLDKFSKWHEAVKSALGIPHPNRSLATGRLRASSAHWTLDYTEPVIVSDGDVRAIVDERGVDFKDGIGDPCDPPLRPAEDPVHDPELGLLPIDYKRPTEDGK